MSSISSNSGTLASPGIGSGLNISALISGLMQVASIPMNSLNTKLQDNQAQISAFGGIKSSLASLQTATQTLYGSSAIAAQTATSSNSSAITATSDGTASTGTHNISVGQLAQQQQMTSNGYSPTDLTFGGTLTFSVGGTAQTPITIAANSSLSDVVSSINSANVGVSASILNDGTQNHLVLTAANSGQANGFTLAVGGGSSANLTQLAYAGGGLPAGYSNMSTAQDAHLTIDGINTTSATNTVTSALSGVTLNLLSTTSSAATVNINWDNKAIANTVTSFINAYNSAIGTIKSTTNYDPASKTAAILNGSSLPSSIQRQLSANMSTTFSQMSSSLGSSFQGTGSFTSIGDLGIALNNDGTLSLNTTKLNSALTSNPSGFMAAFSDFGHFMNNTLQAQLDPAHGTLISMNTGLMSAQKSITNEQTAMQAHLDVLLAQYTAQFNSLDSVLAKMQQTNSTLTAQLTNLGR